MPKAWLTASLTKPIFGGSEDLVNKVFSTFVGDISNYKYLYLIAVAFDTKSHDPSSNGHSEEGNRTDGRVSLGFGVLGFRISHSCSFWIQQLRIRGNMECGARLDFESLEPAPHGHFRDAVY